AEQATNKNKNIVKLLQKSRETYAVFFENVLEEGYQEGLFKNKVDPLLFITTITGTIMQSLLNKHVYADHYGVKVTKEWVREVYLEKVKQHMKLITRNILGYEYDA